MRRTNLINAAMLGAKYQHTAMACCHHALQGMHMFQRPLTHRIRKRSTACVDVERCAFDFNVSTRALSVAREKVKAPTTIGNLCLGFDLRVIGQGRKLLLRQRFSN